MKKSKIEKRLPEPQHSKEQKADGTSVSPAIAKPNVICCQSQALTLGKTKKKLLLLSKDLLLDDFIDLVLSNCKNVYGFSEWFNKKYKTKDFSIYVSIKDNFYVDITQLRSIYFKLHPINNSFKMAIDLVKRKSNL